MTEKSPRQPVLLVILDGFGVNPGGLNNAVIQANTPRLDNYFSHNAHTLLQASGSAVGLPDGQMGNSEVGHLTMGCGDIVQQDLVRIGEAVNDTSFFENPALTEAVNHARTGERPLHLAGLVSDGGVHSDIAHVLALIEMCRRNGVRPVLHMFTDGRDTAPKSALHYLAIVEPALTDAGGAVVTICGRYYAMDRDNRWDRIELAWQAITQAQGEIAESASFAIEASYEAGKTDEFILPTVIAGGEPTQWSDSFVFFNFRKDRARQLTAALYKTEFTHFDRGDYTPLTVTCMTEYDEWYRQPYAFKQTRPRNTVAEVISRAGLQQMHCAETEKYAHVTYFFNGGKGDAFAGEERMIIDSPRVATYDLQPEMSADKVADAVIDAIENENYAFIVVNFANGDMVGHTGIPEAAIRAVETLDKEAGRVLDVARDAGWSVILTADHGNCEEMIDPLSGEPHTQHTVYPVPCLIMDSARWQLSVGAGLSSIAPTILHLMGLPVPDSMTGRSLLLKPVS
ncbi:MAG: 2,3-bisphosphoglycerate-independent phosphoglycerate mutase [Ectothiorhodospiraceae bacterium]|nr:2,3-bisphosphoglycerate-independent phosphoglycerate mutase [Ectothiorhodospiraceae bacterium]